MLNLLATLVVSALPASSARGRDVPRPDTGDRRCRVRRVWRVRPPRSLVPDVPLRGERSGRRRRRTARARLQANRSVTVVRRARRCPRRSRRPTCRRWRWSRCRRCCLFKVPGISTATRAIYPRARSRLRNVRPGPSPQVSDSFARVRVGRVPACVWFVVFARSCSESNGDGHEQRNSFSSVGGGAGRRVSASARCSRRTSGGGASAATAKSATAMNEPQGAGDGVDRVRVPARGRGEGAGGREGDDRRVLRLPVPVLQPRRPDARRRSRRSTASKVRVVFRHNPLPFHANAPLAAEAAVAAEAQGKFWEMHDKLFANQQNLKRPDLEKYAQEIGLDVGKFKAALDSGAGQGARSTPTWRSAKQVGAQRNAELLHRRPQRRRARSRSTSSRRSSTTRSQRADKLIAKGTPPGQVYAAFMKGAKAARRAPRRRAAAAPEGPGRRPRGLQGRRRRRADQGRQAAEGHHRRVLRLPVPVLQPRRTPTLRAG